jgi:hypothetical protein
MPGATARRDDLFPVGSKGMTIVVPGPREYASWLEAARPYPVLVVF